MIITTTKTNIIIITLLSFIFYPALFTSLKNSSSNFKLRLPFGLSPLHKSTPNGCTSSIACLTLEGFNPPAKNSGTSDCSTIFLLSFESCCLHVPPSYLTALFGLPLSKSNASTCSDILTASSTELSSITCITCTIFTAGSFSLSSL